MASVRWPRLFGQQRLTTIALILKALDRERQERLYANHLRPVDPAHHVECVRAYFLCLRRALPSPRTKPSAPSS